MRILLFHPTLLPPRDYGGVERVLLWLARGLVERGHSVFVAALRGSLLPKGCELLEVDARAYSSEDFNASLFKELVQGQNLTRFDCVHFMAPLAQEVWEGLEIPSLLTVHGNGKPGEIYPKNSVFLTKDHARRHGAQKFIYNGIDPSEYQFAPQNKKESYLFLSKTNWRVKNLAGAMQYCESAQVPLQIAGGDRPYWKRISCFFQKNMNWIGPVSGEVKAKLLAEAKALVFPVAWPEPFGLVVAEALISGTPVLASRRGSLPELVPSDVGILLESQEEWVSFLRQGKIPWDPERCRQWALDQFHYSKMTEAYENAYRQIIAGEFLNQQVPVSGDWRSVQ